MTQHAYTIADRPGLAFLADVNAALAAIVTNNSGTTEPVDTYAFMWWADTTTGILKRRNVADDAWISVMSLSLAISTFAETLLGAGDAASVITLLGVLPVDGSVRMSGDLAFAAGKGVVLEGATEDAFEVTLTAVDPTADRTLQLPDKSGVIATLSDITAGKIQNFIAVANTPANGITLTLGATSLDFRSATLNNGVPNSRIIATPISTVISSGSTGGTTNGVAARFIALAIDVAGTVELAWVNQACGLNLDESGLISTVAEGGVGAADSASTIYSNTARANVPYRIVGLFDSNQVTAGTYVTPLSLVQGAGVKALMGIDTRTWQNMVGSRSLTTTYTNSTGREIEVSVTASGPGASTVSGNLIINGVLVATESLNTASGQSFYWNVSGTVPPGGTYQVTHTTSTVYVWAEKR